MDRLETWDRHHNYPIGFAKDAIATGLIATGTVLAIVGYFYFGSRDGIDLTWPSAP
jgi:hypothetical protein